MKRFWKQATTVRGDGGFTIQLDGKPVRTPARRLLTVPTEKLAQAIAGEWKLAGEAIDPRAMPLTGLANAAIDHVAPDPGSFSAGLASYGETDLACYRAERPHALVDRQEKSWDGLLAWAQRRFDVNFCTTSTIAHVAQPEETVRRLAHAVASLDPFRLAGLSPLVTIGGSLVAALAVADGQLSAAQAWAAVTIDEQWQSEQWGADAEAVSTLETRRADFFAAARFLQLLSG